MKGIVLCITAVLFGNVWRRVHPGSAQIEEDLHGDQPSLPEIENVTWTPIEEETGTSVSLVTTSTSSIEASREVTGKPGEKVTVNGTQEEAVVTGSAARSTGSTAESTGSTAKLTARTVRLTGSTKKLTGHTRLSGRTTRSTGSTASSLGNIVTGSMEGSIQRSEKWVEMPSKGSTQTEDDTQTTERANQSGEREVTALVPADTGVGSEQAVDTSPTITGEMSTVAQRTDLQDSRSETIRASSMEVTSQTENTMTGKQQLPTTRWSALGGVGNRTESFTAFRASLLITNWNFTEDFSNETSLAFGALEKLFSSELSQLLNEAAWTVLHFPVNFTVALERFGKGSMVAHCILLARATQQLWLADVNTTLTSALNQSQRSTGHFKMSSGSIEDFHRCEGNICSYNCGVLNGRPECWCLSEVKGLQFGCPTSASSRCEGNHTVILLPEPLARDLDQMTQFLDSSSPPGKCSLGVGGGREEHRVLRLMDHCVNITDNVTDLWLVWKDSETFSLFLKGPNVTACQFSVSSKQKSMFKVINKTVGMKGSFLVKLVRLGNEQSFAFGENKSLKLTLSVETGLTRNPKLFITSCYASDSSEGVGWRTLIQYGCPMSDGVSVFPNGNASSLQLSVTASALSNSTILQCELQVCAEKFCSCTEHVKKMVAPVNTCTSQGSCVEIGPITVVKLKNQRPDLGMVMLITVGSIVLLVLLGNLVGYVGRSLLCISRTTSIVLWLKHFLCPKPPLDNVTLRSCNPLPN